MNALNAFVYSCILLAIPSVSTKTINARQFGNGSSPSVTIDSGPLIGRETQSPGSNGTVHQYLGIPFGQPPLGDLRFSPPQQAEPWNEPYDATTQPMACLQYFGRPGPLREEGEVIFNNPPIPGESEDCLYLNVYVPAGGAANKSVLFWIFGGSGIFGGASLPLYDGTSFAANHDIIVVVPNYRVNLFGYPSTSRVPLEERNLALLDSRLALNWTQENIQAFGGDPDKVTIVGESAGAVAVGELINTYPEEPPFRGAILQSGSAVVIPSLPGHGLEVWDELVSYLNCTETSDEGILACVRAVPAETLQEIIHTNGLVFNKMYADNVTQLENKGAVWAAGNVAKVPILIGSTADEGSYSARSLGDNVTLVLDTIFGPGTEMAQLLGSLYAPDSPATMGLSNGSEIISQIVTDLYFRCTSGFVANLTSNILDVPVWQYVFDALVPSNTWEQYPQLGVYHASEIALVFGTYPRETSTEAEMRLSQSMQKQWADFVKDPSRGPGWEQWPRVAVLGVNETGAVVMTSDVRELDAVCASWDLLYCTMVPEVCGGTNEDRTMTDDSSASGTTPTDTATSTSDVTSASDTNSASHAYIGSMYLVAAGLLALAAFF